MNQLYPIIRRVRRPLVTATVEPPKPAAVIEPVTVTEPARSEVSLPLPVADVAAPKPKAKSKKSRDVVSEN